MRRRGQRGVPRWVAEPHWSDWCCPEDLAGMDAVGGACEVLYRFIDALYLVYGESWPRSPEPGADWPRWPSLPPGYRTAGPGGVAALLQADYRPRPDGPPAEVVAEIRAQRLVHAVVSAGFTG